MLSTDVERMISTDVVNGCGTDERMLSTDMERMNGCLRACTYKSKQELLNAS